MIQLLLMLLTKHLIADFFLQPPYMWKNKGTFLHPGGILHAALHGVMTLAILFAYSPDAVLIAVLEMVAHYFIDFFKMNFNAYYGWQCNKHEKFWWLLGLDQYLHSLCYLAIAAYVFG